ncbi:unnamed protein product [marine sediment metagenome]|uniref:Uncharacterized protein n=1 Tax=marine sediment metagenome TaxID=412755 RepID=X1JZE1_9ZZZZ
MNEEIKLQKIEYYRVLKKPTLKQYLYRRAVQEKMAKIKGKTGVTINPATGKQAAPSPRAGAPEVG